MKGEVADRLPNEYSQQYAVYVYATKPVLSKVWETGFGVRFDLMDENIYNSISKSILKTLADNYFIFSH
jgi:hypothetical protein